MKTSNQRHPKNIWISNGIVSRLYIRTLKGKIRILPRLVGVILGNDILCKLPERIYMPHPYGIVVGAGCIIENDVTLMHQVTLGGKDPYCEESSLEKVFPVIREGAYIGAGAKVLGHITVGAWSIIGANAVVTRDVPDGSVVVGYNQIVRS